MADSEPRFDLADRARMQETARLLRDIYVIVERLQALHPGRSFKPDGHMVGAIGEAWAAWMYDLELLAQSTETHDATTRGGRLVQVKATQGKSIGLSSEPEHLIVLAIDADGAPSEIFNGPGVVAWQKVGPKQKTGQRAIRVSTLAALMEGVPTADRLPLVNSVEDRRGQRSAH